MSVPKSKPPTEHEIERTILDWLAHQPKCWVWKNKSVGVYDTKRGVFRQTSGIHSAVGTSDILGIWHGQMLCIEVKTKRGKLSVEQAFFLDGMAKLGAIAFVARSLEDVTDRLTARALSP